MQVDVAHHRLERTPQRRLVAHQQAQRPEVRQPPRFGQAQAESLVAARCAASSSSARTARLDTFRSGRPAARCGSPASDSSASGSRPHAAREVGVTGEAGAAQEGGHGDFPMVSRNGNRLSRSVKSTFALAANTEGILSNQGATRWTARPLPPPTPVCDRMRASGNWNPNWEPFYALDPEWTEKFMTMGMAPMLSGVLDAKTIEFLAIAVDASCTHMYGPGVRRHIRKALEARRHAGRNHRRAAADQRAGHPHDEPGRTDPARRTGGAPGRRDAAPR